jgi:c-di-AMP phosphodiesterase-like protein
MKKHVLQKVFFWTLFPLFIIICILTILALFTPVIKIDPEYKKPIVYAFVLEVAILVAALFREVFGLKKKEQEGEVPKQDIKIVAKETETVDDAPIGVIKLNKEVVHDKIVIQQTPDKFVRNLLSKEEFQKKFFLRMIMYEALDRTGSNINIELRPNTLGQLDITLKQYQEHELAALGSIFSIKDSKKELRVNNTGTMSLSWYTLLVPNPNKPGEFIEVMQYAKHVVVEDIIAILAISYNPGITHPENIRILQALLEEFGTEQKV